MRKYKRVDRARRGRMLRAVRLRAEGLSLRQIAAKVGASHGTVIADLRRWEQENSGVVSLPGQKLAPGGEEFTTSPDQPRAEIADIVQLRRAQ